MIVQRAAGHDPAHVRPEAAIARRMRITLYVGILVMYAVCRHPEKRAAFQRQRGAERQEILHPFMGLEAAMREQTVISNADSQASRNPPQYHCSEKSLPCKHEERSDRANMKSDHEKRGELANRLAK